MIRQILLLLPVALVIGLSPQVAGQKNKIPDQARAILEQASQFELLSIGHYPSPANPTGGLPGMACHWKNNNQRPECPQATRGRAGERG